MPRAGDVVSSESESERPRSGSTKKTYAAKKHRRASTDAEEEEEEAEPDPPKESGEDEDEDEGEEEYEIEQIVDARRGGFPSGGFGYLVKWKGYGPEHNSWVDEQDAGNAQQLIDDYWRKNKKDPRKSIDQPKKGRRKSSVRAETPESSTVSKKRGRPSKSTKKDSDKEMSDDEEENTESRAAKKPRKSNGVTQKKTASTIPKKKKVESAPIELDDEDDEDAVVLGSMEKHMSIPSWESMVDSIDTIERGEDKKLYVYFRIKKNPDERMREPSTLCAEKFPKTLISFYEANLRWKLEEQDS
ncbi:hypothetical protein BJ138DRAFT_1114228 [Hygrophoropsis aurantiaca]|uniref:Uncharacterized protein n=1 Tax=Hygrophoropsis aurantiaca TaxID=72124 RepID=A0ACB8AB54_9AGAM|nr:hypothetical protein BJ138DRAFT_1114228 [Hygrophoropsis aurantiaca]